MRGRGEGEKMEELESKRSSKQIKKRIGGFCGRHLEIKEF
jgi:hypothetical protein